MSLAPSRTTQPMSLPWVNARRDKPARLRVRLERRVSLVVEDRCAPVAELDARVFAMELVALLTVERADGSVLEQRRVRAHSGDRARFAAAVVEQTELACHLCPGITVAVSSGDEPDWHPVRAALAALAIDGAPLAVEELGVARGYSLAAEDLEMTRRARRRPLGTPPPFTR